MAPQAEITAAIPNRPVFRAQEVCEIAQLQPYVLRSWEAEFPDLGVSKKTGDARVYRRADVERVLQLKHLLFVDGLTLAGARKRLGVKTVPIVVPAAEQARGREARVRERERPEEETVIDADVAALIDDETRQELIDVRRGLQWILGVLAGGGAVAEETVHATRRVPARTSRRAVARRPARRAAKVVKPVKRTAKRRKR